eukprot:4765150-Ditylum_brightwellii.AAC.1
MSQHKISTWTFERGISHRTTFHGTAESSPTGKWECTPLPQGSQEQQRLCPALVVTRDQTLSPIYKRNYQSAFGMDSIYPMGE